MNLTELSQQIAERFRRAERAAPAVYECGADRGADLVSYALAALFTDAQVGNKWTGHGGHKGERRELGGSTRADRAHAVHHRDGRRSIRR